MTKQEAEIIGKLDKRHKQRTKRRSDERRFYVPKTRVWRSQECKSKSGRSGK